MQSANREPMIMIIQFLHASFEHFYPTVESDKLVRLQKCESDARKGTILFAMLDIYYNEYTVLSPKGGCLNAGADLFKESLPLLNINNLFFSFIFIL